jgi:FKBP-type peptidyl-prolyl cis-trans isomerase SlyD
MNAVIVYVRTSRRGSMKHTKRVAEIALTAVLGFFLIFGSVHAADKTKGTDAKTIAAGNKVSIEYTLTLADKKVIDTNVGKEPLTFEEGAHQVIPGMEKGLLGMKKGQSKKLVIKPEDGYGPLQKEAIKTVDLNKLPPDAQKVDAQVQASTPDGQVARGRVTEVKNDKATIDFNHPLAGKTLYFDVKILDVK